EILRSNLCVQLITSDPDFWNFDARHQAAGWVRDELELATGLSQQALDDGQAKAGPAYTGTSQLAPRKRPQQALHVGGSNSGALVFYLDCKNITLLPGGQPDPCAAIRWRASVTAGVFDKIADN